VHHVKYVIKNGTFCPNCDIIRDSTQFLINKKLEIKNKQLLKTKTPKFSIHTEICSNCRGKRIHITKEKEAIKVDFDKGQNEWKVHRNNPFTKCQCKRCGDKWRGGLPTPSEPHYKLPTRITKDKLRLILRRVPRNQISVPKKLNKMVKEILEES